MFLYAFVQAHGMYQMYSDSNINCGLWGLRSCPWRLISFNDGLLWWDADNMGGSEGTGAYGYFLYLPSICCEFKLLLRNNILTKIN